MTAISARVQRLLDEKVRPMLMDRGGDLEFREFSEGVLKLSVVGSPGASIPVRDRVSELIQHYVAEVRRVEFVTGTEAGIDSDSSLAGAVLQVIEKQINPSVAAHGGSVRLVEVAGDTAIIRFEGGCQGCAMAHVTLCQGVEVLIKNQVPDILAVVDATDHESGTSPYFKTRKS